MSDNARLHTYQNGQPYRPPKSREGGTAEIVDSLGHSHSVVSGRPDADTFLRLIDRELKIRFYSQATQKNYTRVIARFLDWFGRPPHHVVREDVRQYLEVLVDGGASSSLVSQTLSALRTVFDKFCHRSTTTGLATPRRPGRQPVVLSQAEVRMMLSAARCLRDKLLMSLMYGIGLRVSEVSRLQWTDICFDRRTVRVFRGKGQKDRLVILPDRLIAPLQDIRNLSHPTGFVFPDQRGRSNRHISSRTVQRIVARTRILAGVDRQVTPHSFRHSFATHLIEDGLDIRFIQKLLGHASLETTTLYTRVAKLKPGAIRSPLDQLDLEVDEGAQSVSGHEIIGRKRTSSRVGQMRMEVRLRDDHTQPTVGTDRHGDGSRDAVDTGPAEALARLRILPPAGGAHRGDGRNTDNETPIWLTGIVLKEARPGWVSVELPNEEAWADVTGRLPLAQQERLRCPDFLDTLRLRLTAKFLQLLKDRSSPRSTSSVPTA